MNVTTDGDGTFDGLNVTLINEDFSCLLANATQRRGGGGGGLASVGAFRGERRRIEVKKEGKQITHLVTESLDV